MELRICHMKFFSFIRIHFGITSCNLLKEFIRLTEQCIMLRIRISFMNTCNRLNLTPPHLNFLHRYERISFFQESSSKNLKASLLRHVKAVIRLELNDAYKQLLFIRNRIYKVYNNILKSLPWFITKQFFGRQENNNRLKWSKEMSRINKKIELLTSRKIVNIKKDIKPIKYFYNDNDRKELSISLSNEIVSLKEINILPNEFSLESPLNKLHDKWFVNLSKKTIPEEVSLLLQLGERFNLPFKTNDNSKITVEFIKCIEKNLFKETEVISSAIRNQSIPIIKRMYNTTKNINNNEKFLLRCLHHTKKYVKNNPDILFTKADKGNATVAIDVLEYNNKMIENLSDTNTYIVIKKDPIKKLSNNVKNVLSVWLKKEYIDIRTYRRLLITDGMLPRAYGLPKLHKEGYPLRIIVSSLKSPLYELALYLHNIIKCSVPEAASSVVNSFKLVKELDGKIMDSGCTFASLDVVSLFTNVPHELVYEGILSRWKLIKRNTAIPKEEFINAIKLILESTYFSFNKIIYKQIFGTPMGSPLSPIVADLVLQDLETRAIKKLPFELSLYRRYVDDILLAAFLDQFKVILDVFNSFHGRLQFTLETSINNSINFLDVTIILDDQRILFDRYEKPTNTGRYINYHSQHPVSQKRSIVYGLVDRTVLLSHPMFHEKNLKGLINTLLENCFPLPFIFATINTRIKTLANRNVKDRGNYLSQVSDKNFFTIPYVKSISESFLPTVNKFGFNIAYSSFNTLNKFIKRGKDKIDLMSQNEIVYKINCLNCNSSYVGQTKRQFKTRLKEHKSDINKKNGNLSVVSNHRLEHNHDMNWDEAKILDMESSYIKRTVSEMIYIKRQGNSLNKQSDTDLLPDVYLPIIENLPLF